LKKLKVPLTPFWAGSLARTVTTVAVSPIELIRTKQQSLNHSSSILNILNSELKKRKWIKKLMAWCCANFMERCAIFSDLLDFL